MAPAIVGVTGGKGGTGKSFVATNLAVALSGETSLVLADLDVEAPNDHILLGVDRLEGEEPIAVFFPIIDYKRCTACGACAKACDTGAIVMARGRPPMVFPRLCSGCRACLYVCPYQAISPDGRRVVGYTYSTPVRRGGGFRLVTGILREGEEHTPPAVVAAKRRALREAEGARLLLVDTGAGSGNSITAALQYASLIVAVTEPTPLGLHDLRAILEIARGLGARVWVVVNRAGIGDDTPHRRLAREYGAELVEAIPYDPGAVKAYARGEPVVEACPECPSAKALQGLAEALAGEIRVLGVGQA